MDVEGRRLLWRCRRGLKELDVVLERYVRWLLPRATPAERQLLGELLELPDPELADYLLGSAVSSDPAMARLIAAIRNSDGRGPRGAKCQSVA
jgi:antitoxin CptB